MKITKLATFIETPEINSRLSWPVLETLRDTIADAGLVGFDYADPVLVLVPLSKISPSVTMRRRLHTALDFPGTSMEDDTKQLVERLKAWRLNHETLETTRRSHDAMKAMVEVMFASAQSRSTVGAMASRGDLIEGVLKSGSPILGSFGENFVNYALEVFGYRSEPSLV